MELTSPEPSYIRSIQFSRCQMLQHETCTLYLYSVPRSLEAEHQTPPFAHENKLCEPISAVEKSPYSGMQSSQPSLILFIAWKKQKEEIH